MRACVHLRGGFLMRSLLDVSVRSGLLPASILLLAVACQASNGGSTTHGSGANGATSNSGGSPNLGGLHLPMGGTRATPNTYDGAINSDCGAQITVTGANKDVHLTLISADGTPVTDGITWSVDDTKIGSISGDGTFHANGYVGGVATLTATVSNSSLAVELTV